LTTGIIVSIALAMFGWGIGFVAGLISSTLLDRRRAYRSLLSEIESIRSEFHDSARFEELHRLSVESLKPLIFAAMPFLGHVQQKKAREAWAGYRDAQISHLPKEGFEARLADFHGEPLITQQKAMDSALDRIQSHFCIWP